MAAKWVDEVGINPIMNYFPHRQHTEKVLRDIENTVLKSKCFTVKDAKTAKNLKLLEMNLSKKVFGHLIKKENTGMLMILIGALETGYLSFDQ